MSSPSRRPHADECLRDAVEHFADIENVRKRVEKAVENFEARSRIVLLRRPIGKMIPRPMGVHYILLTSFTSSNPQRQAATTEKAFCNPMWTGSQFFLCISEPVAHC